MKVGDLVKGRSPLEGTERIGIIIEVMEHVGYSVISERYRVYWPATNSIWWHSKGNIELLK